MTVAFPITPWWQRENSIGRPWAAPSPKVMKRFESESHQERQQHEEGDAEGRGRARASGAGEDSFQIPQPRRMATLRERYRLNDDDENLFPGTSAGPSMGHSSYSEGTGLAPMPMPSGVASSASEEPMERSERHTTSAMKRRRSRSDSPSRPRSQKGSAESVIASARRMDEDFVSASKQRKEGGHPDEDSSADVSSTSRKAARLSGPGQAFKRAGSNISDSESTSAASSLREKPLRSRMSSPTGGSTRQGLGQRGSERSQDDAYYTWQSTHPAYESRRLPSIRREEEAESTKESAAATRRLPLLQTDVERAQGPGSAPQISRYSTGQRSRSNSPSSQSRLPSHSTGHRENPARLYGEQSRPGYEYYSQRGSKYEPQGRYEQYPGRRSMSYDMESVSEGTPRLSGQYHGAHGEGSSSQAAQVNPGQAFIHPSLAGLPGAGGGAGSKQQPSFVSKLYSMLEDSTIADMISWGPSGATFSVANPAEFAKVVLPNWFKHSNWQSFVRQLNMYGFHKVNHTYQGTPDDEIQIWEFKHPNFRRGEVQLLGEIKRKSSRHKRQDSLTRGMVGVAEFEYSGSPSPEMGLSHMRLRGMTGPAHPAPHSSYTSVPAGLTQAQAGPSAQPISSEARYASGAGYYREYPSVAPSSGARGSFQGEASRAAVPAPPPAGLAGTDSVSLRFEEVSERIDAVIRHATFYEAEMRSLKEHIYTLEQNEGSLRAHVHHLEAQMRTLSDQLSQQQQASQQPQARLPPPPSYQHQPRMPSASPTLRTREQGQQQHAPLAPPPPPSTGYSGRSPSLAHRGGYSMAAHRSQGQAGSSSMSSMPSPSAEPYQQRQGASSGHASSMAAPGSGSGTLRHHSSSASMHRDDEL